MVSAPTGTGKTAAFVLPALQRLLKPAKPGRGPRMLVLTPTRELALQVYNRCRKVQQVHAAVRTGTVIWAACRTRNSAGCSKCRSISRRDARSPDRFIDQARSISRVWNARTR
jgi:Lhr-like helicase